MAITTDFAPPASIAGAPTKAAGKAPSVALAVTRIVLGFVFLWTFLDKAFGLGFGTPADKAWLSGSSPTAGFLSSTDGTFAPTFHVLAGHAWVDWAFMLGMLAVGSALVLGIAMRLAALGTGLLMGLLWLASLPLEHNPAVDEHVVYACAAVALAVTRAGHAFGLGSRWDALPIVRSHRWFQ